MTQNLSVVSSFYCCRVSVYGCVTFSSSLCQVINNWVIFIWEVSWIMVLYISIHVPRLYEHLMWAYVFISFLWQLWSRSVDSHIKFRSVYLFKELPNCFPKWVHHFTCSSTCYAFQFLCILTIQYFLPWLSHSSGYEVVLPCSLI